ncbi:MAG TPA: TIGR04283 family arsenosugar biosynthesis glycosyltransferase [Flavisolibacter sp.]
MISVIIPVFNEAAFIGETIRILREQDQAELITEIIVADGGSKDDTLAIATAAGAVVVTSPVKGRAAQMNYGAAMAEGSILYFLHADTIPPWKFTNDILAATQAGFQTGCFMLRFDLPHWFLRLNCWFTRFNVSAFHYGDASLYVPRTLFKDVGGFSEDHIVFEDYDLVEKLKSRGSFHIIRRAVITSARKYRVNGVFKMQVIFYLMYGLYRLRLPQQKLLSVYKSLIRQDKL